LDQVKVFAGLGSERDLGSGELPEEVVQITHKWSMRDKPDGWGEIVKKKFKILIGSLRDRCLKGRQ